MVCSSLSHPENGEEKECIISLWWGIKDKVICSITAGFWSSLSTSFARENAPLSLFVLCIHPFVQVISSLSRSPKAMPKVSSSLLSSDILILLTNLVPPSLFSWTISQTQSSPVPFLSPYSSSGLSPFSLLKAAFLSLITSSILV